MNDISQPVRITCVDLPFPPLLPSFLPSFLPPSLPLSISTSLLPYLPTSPSLPPSLSLLAYLIKLLEQHSCQLHWEPGFVTLMFHQIRVSYPSLFTLYNGMFNEKVHIYLCNVLHPFIHSSIYLPIHSIIYSFIYPIVHPFIHLPMHLSSIYSSILLIYYSLFIGHILAVYWTSSSYSFSSYSGSP